jgi:hypothetical protein
MFRFLKKAFNPEITEEMLSNALNELKGKRLSQSSTLNQLDKIDPVAEYFVGPLGLSVIVKSTMSLYPKLSKKGDAPIINSVAIVYVGFGTSWEKLRGKIFTNTADGLIENEFDKGKVIVKFNDTLQGSIDLVNKKIFSKDNKEIGTFGLPNVVWGAGRGFKIFLNKQLAAYLDANTWNIHPTSATFFENINPDLTEAKKILVLSLGIFGKMRAQWTAN